MDKNTERMFEMKRKILSYILLMVMVLTLVGCGAESSNENQKDNIQGTTNSENAGSSSEQVQGSTDAPTTTPEPTEAPVTEVVVGKSITTVEDGCTYYIAETDTTLEAGAEIPTPSVGDKYETPDYKYSYGFERGDKEIIEWNIKVKDKTKESYGEILYSIAGNKLTNMCKTFSECTNLLESPAIPSGVISLYNTYYKCEKMTVAPKIPNGVTDLWGTFSNCKSLTEAPEIPNGVTRMNRTFCACKVLTTAPVIPDSVENMEETFSGCTNLVNAPVIPENVTNMKGTFSDCISLTTAPVIPENVDNMHSTFADCTGLTGTIEINASPYNYRYCFLHVNFTEQNLTLTGSSEKLEELMKETQ